MRIITGVRAAEVQIVPRVNETFVTVKRLRDAGAAPVGRIWGELKWTITKGGDFASMTREQFDGRKVQA